MKDNGYSAFPHSVGGTHFFGMTLRDYFAAKAMQALIGDSQPHTQHEVVEKAYLIADAMLKERAK